MENLIRILRSIEFIENNLKENISLKDIAAKAYFSDFYFHKLFHLLIGDSPGEYIKKRRLYEAALAIRNSDVKVIDAAYEYGYQSPEAFSRAFSKHFGFSPIEVKNNQTRLIPYPKPALTLTDLNHIHEGVSMEPEIIEKEEMKFVGPVYYGDNSSNEIPEFWGKHFGKVTEISTKKGNGCYGVCFHTTDYVEKGLFHYMPAVEVENFSIIPLEAVGKIIPKHKYAVFTHKGKPDNLGETYKYIHGTWFPHKKYEIHEGFDFEHYTQDEHGNNVIRIHVPIIDK